MKGFKEFLMRGNLVELAVAFIMGTVFAAVVTAFTDLLMDIIGRFFGVPNFSQATVSGINLGPFLSAAVNFLLIAFVVYFFVVKPYNSLRDRLKKEEPEVAATSEELLTEIRDLLSERKN